MQPTQHQHHQTTGENRTREAALLATFYIPREVIPSPTKPLVERLARQFGLEKCPPGQRYLGSWRSPDSRVLLNTFLLPAAQDTAVVQLVFNTQDAAEVAWERLRVQIEPCLDEDLLVSLWGYTIIYYAVLVPKVTPEDAIESLQAAACAPFSPAPARALAQSTVDSGMLWLFHVPLHTHGRAAVTVYVGLSHFQKHDDPMIRAIYGPDAVLLMPDVLAHRCYHLLRDYEQSNLQSRFDEIADALRTTTTTLLQHVQDGSSTGQDVHDLTCNHNRLNSVVVALDELRTVLQWHLQAYRWWREQAACGDVIEFHYNQIDQASRDIDIHVSKGENALRNTSMNIQTIGTAMQIVQVNLDRDEKRRDQIIQMLLAIVGAALAVPEFIDREAVEEILTAFGIPGAENMFVQLAVQGTITVVFALVIWLVVKAINPRPTTNV